MSMPSSGLVGLNPDNHDPSERCPAPGQADRDHPCGHYQPHRAGRLGSRPAEELPGVAFLLSRVIDRGTLGWSADEIAEALDIRGVSLRVAVTRHTLSISCDCLAEDFDTVLQLLADVVRNPVIPENELVTRRGEVLTAIRQDQDSPATVAMERLMKLLYGSNSSVWPTDEGHSLHLSTRLGRDRLQQFHRDRISRPEASRSWLSAT